jgi:hypothetical protein
MIDSARSYEFPIYRLFQHIPDLFLAINESVKEDLIKSGVKNEKILVGTISVDKSNFDTDINHLGYRHKLGLNEEHFVILRTARLAQNKGHRDYLYVIKQIVEKIPYVRYLLVGSGNLQDKLEKLTCKLGISQNVIFLGERRDIARLNLISDIAFIRGFGNVCLEHFSYGVPVCTFDTDGAREIIRHGVNGFVFPHGDIANMAKEIIRVINNRPKLISMRESVQKTISNHYSFQCEANIWQNAYHKLIS